MIERATEGNFSAKVPLAHEELGNGLSAGEMLRQARQSHGLDASVLAAALKVPTQKIEALEAGDFSALPDPVFTRALAASVCRILHVDATAVLARLPEVPRSGLNDTRPTVGTTFRPNVLRRRGGEFLPRRILLGIALLLVGAGVLFWIPQSAFDKWGGRIAALMARTSMHAPSAPPSSVPDVSSPPTGTVPSSSMPPMDAAPVPAPSTGAFPPSASPAPQAAVANPPAASQPAVMGTPAQGSGDVLVLTARDASWVSVSEVGGKSLLRRQLQPGETVNLPATRPLAVVLGRASGVDVQVRGKPFDLAPVTRSGGIAQFEVKP